MIKLCFTLQPLVEKKVTLMLKTEVLFYDYPIYSADEISLILDFFAEIDRGS